MSDLTRRATREKRTTSFKIAYLGLNRNIFDRVPPLYSKLLPSRSHRKAPAIVANETRSKPNGEEHLEDHRQHRRHRRGRKHDQQQRGQLRALYRYRAVHVSWAQHRPRQGEQEVEPVPMSTAEYGEATLKRQIFHAASYSSLCRV